MLVGVSGHLNSGKDTVAKLIATNLHEKYPVYRKSFAFKLKQIVELLSGYKMTISYSNDFIDGITDFSQEDKNVFIPMFNMTVGEMLQQIGTNVFRDHFDKQTWIKALFIGYGEYERKNTVWVISDVRFTNEAQKVKDLNGILIRVNRQIEDTTTSRDINHPSEIALDNYSEFDYTIDNNKSLQDLELETNSIVNKILKKWKNK